MTGLFTAALATEDSTGPYCDVTVLINDEDGQVTDRSALPWIALAGAPLADPDRLAKGLDAAPGVLAAQGWRLTGEWVIAANAAYAPAEPMPQLLVSVPDIKGGALGQMPGVTGVWWTDTRWLECTEHLSSPFWTPDDPGTGVVLSGPADPAWCDAHREAAAATDPETYVRARCTPDVAGYLLAADGFKVADDKPNPSAARGPRSTGLAAAWRSIFDELVAAGYMHQSNSGRYWWSEVPVTEVTR